VVDHPEFGWQAFGGNVTSDGDWVRVQPLDAFRQRVYVAPRGLWLTLDSGTFESIEINTKTHAVRVGLSAATPSTQQARLRIDQPARAGSVGVYHPKETLAKERDAFAVKLQNKISWIDLID